jgi:hypothetical protein
VGQKKYFLVSNEILQVSFFAVLLGLIYFGVFHFYYVQDRGDFLQHSLVAQKLFHGGNFPPHFFYQILMIGANKLLCVSFKNAMLWVPSIFVSVTFIVAYRLFYEGGLKKNYALSAASFLLLSHPIALLFFYDHHLYFGYFATNVYHNPTIILLKPLALLHFACLIKLCENSERNVVGIVWCAVLSILSIITKPNYIIVLLPALLIFLSIKQFFYKETIRTWLVPIIFGVVLPSVLILLLQYCFFYLHSSKNTIGFGLFEVFSVQSKLWTLIPKLVFSIAFSLSVLLLLRKTLFKQAEFQLVAIMFLLSICYAYFLVDTVNGESTLAGNFWWSVQIANFLLLFVTTKIYGVYWQNNKDKVIDCRSQCIKLYFPAVVALLQLLSGLIWLGSNLYADLAW